ncbi:hypothetical protein FQZ14_08135, partial [Campylobacter lari]|nr:hypothetical protein [Campylobacter lari]
MANKEHKKIIVYEKDIELIFLALNMIDFYDELNNGRFIIIHNEEMNYTKADLLCSFLNLFLKTYNLHIHSKFYEEQKKDINYINTLNVKAIRSIALRKGNDPVDAMQGVEQSPGVTTLKGAMAMMDIVETATANLDAIRADIGAV